MPIGLAWAEDVQIFGQDPLKGNLMNAPVRYHALIDNGTTPSASLRKIGTIPCRANAAAPSWSEGRAEPLSCTLAGDLRVTGTFTPNGTIGAAPPSTTFLNAGIGSGATGGLLTGITVCDSFANVDIVTAATTLIVTGVSGRHVRICSYSLFSSLAENVAIISGTGATCGTGTTSMNGGATSAEGWNFAANQGIAQGSGLGEINRTNATGDSVCFITSSTSQLSGRIGYAIY